MSLSNHYYPYGGLIGNLSTNPDKQKYKYNGKEYDTMHGLNTYDYGARQYDGAKIVWDRMDQSMRMQRFLHQTFMLWAG